MAGYQHVLTDLRRAFRALVRSPGFTVTAIATLALGIGATTAIFSVVNAVLLRPLPYAQPERLVRIYSEFPNFANGGLRRFQVSFPEYVDLRTGLTAWQSLDLWVTKGVNLSGGGARDRIAAAFITGGMMHTLGAQPLLGRTIIPADDSPGAAPAAVISHGLWRRAFAASPGVLGKEVLLDGSKYTIVGVMGETFRLPPGEHNPSDVWIPLQIDLTNPGVWGAGVVARGSHVFNLLGRLKPGVTLQQARVELDSLVAHSAQNTGDHHFQAREHTLVAYELHDEVVRGVKYALLILLAAVGFLLLISCVNVANLLLARAEARQREIAIRGALGASVWRLASQFMSEALVLSSAGALLGVALAQAGVALFSNSGAGGLPRASEIGIDGNVVLFVVATVALVCVLFGLTPLVHVLKRDLYAPMKAAGGSTTQSRQTQRVRQSLVVCQLALALILLMGTGLMLRTIWNLQAVDSGVEPRSVTSMSVALPPIVQRQGVQDFWSRLEARIQAVPGVEAAALTTALPPVYPSAQMDTQIEGFVATSAAPVQIVDHYNVVSSRYFDTLRIPLLEGRVFDERDVAQSPKVALVNQTMARMFWPDRSALGRRVKPGGSPDWYTVVGVVADTKNDGLERPAGTELYLAPLQTPEGVDLMRGAHIVVRAPGNPARLVNAVRRELNEINPTLPLGRAFAMEEIIAEAQSRPRLLALLLTAFAVVALVLAAVGIYGVISYAVAQRTREFGLRVALGAQPRAVFKLVLQQGGVLILWGVVVGLCGAWALTRFLSSLLFGVPALDPATFVGVTLLLSVVALCATYLPSRYATKVDPMIALRTE